MTTAIAPPAPEQTYFAVVPQGLQNPNSLASSSTSSSASTSPSPSTHRYLRLPHPRNDKPSLYLVYRPTEEESEEVVLEVQSINPEKQRSWFYGEQVVGDGSLLLMTTINPVYLIIPLLISHLTTPISSSSPSSSSSTIPLQTALDQETQGKRTDRFLPYDDLVDSLTRLERCRLPQPFARVLPAQGKSRARGEVGRRDMSMEDEEEDEMDLEIERMRLKAGRIGGEEGEEDEGDQVEGNEDVARFCEVGCVSKMIKGLCETQDLAGETFYRPSLTLIIQTLRTKLNLISHPGTFQTLPSLQRTLTSIGLGPLIESLRIEIVGGGGDNVDSLNNETNPATTTTTTVEIKVDVRKAEDEKVLGLARTKVALDVMGQYLGSGVKDVLMGSYDFTPLEQYLETQEALSYAASRPITQSGGPGGDDAMMDLLEGRDGKRVGGGAAVGLKRKGSEKGSRAAEALKKVNTSKMPKLTTFFKKK